MGLAIIVGLAAVAENLLQPMIMGKGLSISPTVVFLSCMFWLFILSGPGAFLAMPITMTILLFMGYCKETRGLAAMLVTTPKLAIVSKPKATTETTS